MQTHFHEKEGECLPLCGRGWAPGPLQATLQSPDVIRIWVLLGFYPWAPIHRHLLKRPSFLHCILLNTWRSLFLGSAARLHWSILLPIPPCLCPGTTQEALLTSTKIMPSASFCFFKIILVIIGPYLSMSQDCPSLFKTCWDLTFAWNPPINLGRTGFLQGWTSQCMNSQYSSIF